jgi:hypothetical protein
VSNRIGGFFAMSAQLGLSMMCVCCVAGCESEKTQRARAPEQAEAPAPGELWGASLIESTGEHVLKIKRRDADAFMPFTTGQTIEPGDTISTGTHAQVTLKISPGDGEVFLDHLSEATLLSTGPGLALHRGHALVTSPHFDEESRPAQRPQVILPTGKVTLTGTRISAHATPEEGRITVSQGEVSVEGVGGTALTASFGQEIVLRDAQPPVVLNAPDIGQAFSWSESSVRQDESLPQLERGMGKLVARRPYSEVEQALELRDHTINVRIQGMMAYTEITEEFHNPGGDNLEGLYRFPLPPDAQISRLSLLVGNRWMEGQFLENARAERIWREITTEPRVQPRDPALLQWKQGNQFELRIFPIPPRSSRKIKIGYVQKLQPTGDGYRYTYPMPIDRSGQSQATHFRFDATVQGIDSQHPVTLEHYSGHKITRKEEGLTALSFERQDFRPSGDLNLRFMLPAEQKEIRTYTFADPRKPKDDAYVAVSIRPQFESAKTADGRDFVVVIDRSYGRKGAAMAIQRALTTQLVHELDPEDRVRVIACESTCSAVGPKRFERANAGLVAELTPALDALDARGSTYSVEAMRSAARIFAQRETEAKGRPTHVIYMTDGVVSAGPAHPSTLERATQKVFEATRPRLSVISFGGDEDRANLQALAHSVGGDVLDLKPGASMIGSALDILRHHYSAPLEEIAVQWPVGVEQVYPEKTGRLLPGEEITLVARLNRDITQDKLVLRGVQNGQVKEMTYSLDLSRAKSAKGNAFVPRLWAKHRIDALELSDADVRKEVVALSRQFGILTRYTSLLALESEEMMREFNVSHQDHIDWLGDEAPEGEDEAAEIFGGKIGARGKGPMLGKKGGGRRSAMSGEGGEMIMPSGGDTRSKESAKPMKKEARKDFKFSELDDADSFEELENKKSDEKMPMADVPSTADTTTAAERQDNRLSDGLLGELDRSPAKTSKKKPTTRTLSKGRRPRCSGRTYYFATEDASPATDYYVRRAERARVALRDDATNRTKYMDAIRRAMKLGPQGQQEAERLIASWLEINDMDPEALVLRGQVALNEGDVIEAKRWLFSAPDAAARAPWLLERVKDASRLFGDRAMACAYAQTIADTKPKRDANQDLLECHASTSAVMLFEGAAPETQQVVVRDDRPTGRNVQLSIKARWSGPEQLHLVLVEPTGRLLSAMSTRQRLVVHNEPGEQVLELPRLRQGSYDVRIVREHATGAPLPVELEVRLQGKLTPKQVVLSGLSDEVAQITRKSKRACD